MLVVLLKASFGSHSIGSAWFISSNVVGSQIRAPIVVCWQNIVRAEAPDMICVVTVAHSLYLVGQWVSTVIWTSSATGFLVGCLLERG